MTIAGIVLIVIAVAFCILVMALVPTILKFKRMAESVTSLSDMLQKELKPTIQDLNEVLTDMKTVGGGIAEHAEDVKEFISALAETGNNLHTINRTVSVVTNVLNTTSIWASGAKVAGKYLLERYLKKRGGN